MIRREHIIAAVVILFGFIALRIHHKYAEQPQCVPQQIVQKPHVEKPIPPPEQKPVISSSVPLRTLSLEEVQQQLERWHEEAPAITELGVVGKSDEGRDIHYIRIGKHTGPKIMIMATIHGNEKSSTVVTMTIFEKLLKEYMSNDEITNLLRTRDIFYVPIASPDGYAHNSRYVSPEGGDEGLDPNRQFNGPNLSEKHTLTTIESLKEFYNKYKFVAVMSCHNFGRDHFYPWGYTSEPTDRDAEYRDLAGRMAALSGYDFRQIHGESSPPYYGYEIDWFHSNGAFSMLTEIGNDFVAEGEDVKKESHDIYPAFVLFMKEAGQKQKEQKKPEQKQPIVIEETIGGRIQFPGPGQPYIPAQKPE